MKKKQDDFFDVNPGEQHIKVNFGELIDGLIKNVNEMNTFNTYLTEFANPKPHSILNGYL
ncbi:hypothetical protein F442_04542 [Phytophthora nicotianae P10297]|uniref:Uncharacterized protein n=2 Tax=Phytophthora nicotianae TaxID=4792 RepID=W2ZRV5_PHYNI|nr:hypothetical protein L915_10841 [Phytophthora nicotianae]ETL37605.1 hypothetical protein L916_10734 [Phytophthora nicotianae]ETM44045.1 hypothetical protein L914_10683 [Phytophthora nicotianae]ETP50038.1 hypothetical protein F442_04544 [Phytophthora nicotianae P10297]ETP50043.1 hypothetical protein F442_04542 [Phytophthora nicotianae P10297]